MMRTLCMSLVLFCSSLSRAGGVEGPYLHHAVVGAPLQKETHIWGSLLDSWLLLSVVSWLVVSVPLTEVVP